jgi:hypothetical protein
LQGNRQKDTHPEKELSFSDGKLWLFHVEEERNVWLAFFCARWMRYFMNVMTDFLDYSGEYIADMHSSKHADGHVL